jgi:hypothetical protein
MPFRSVKLLNFYFKENQNRRSCPLIAPLYDIFVFIYFGLKIKLLWKNFFLKIQNGGIISYKR